MRRCTLLVPFVVLDALVALTIGVASVSGAGAPFAMVQGYGTADFGAPAPSEIAIVAVQAPSGVVNGHVFQTDQSLGTTALQVTCVRLSTFTTRVAIGGVIVSSYAAPMVGQEALYVVDDLSTTSAQLDQVSGAGLGPGASTCPYDPGYVTSPLTDLVSGDYRVRIH